MSISPKQLRAVKRMYNALLSIGAQEIANTCLREMNTEHTQLIAKAIGLEGKRG